MARLRIREISEQKGIKQSHLQMEARVTPPLLNRYWHNRTDSVTLSALERIAKVLGVRSGDLIVDEREDLMQDKRPRDRKGNLIGIGNILIARRDDGEESRYKVLAVDTLQGSGSVQLECLSPVAPGFERRWESRYNLWQMYEIEAQQPST